MDQRYRTESTVETPPISNESAERVSKSNAIGAMSSPGKRFLVPLSLLSLYLIWGMTYLAMRIGLEAFPPFLLAAMRFLIAGAILYVVLRLRGAARPTRKQWIGAAVIGILLLAGGNGGVIFSEQWVATGLAAVGIAAVPLWTAVFSGLWGRWPTRNEWLGLSIGFVGVILLNVGQGMWTNPEGAIALLIAPIAWALGSAWSKHITLPPGLMSSAAEMLAGGVVLVLMSLGTREHAPDIAKIGPSLLALGFLVVFGSLVAFNAYTYLLRTVRPALATSYAYVNPLVAIGLGVILAGEQLTILEILAVVVILSGVALVTLGRQRA